MASAQSNQRISNVTDSQRYSDFLAPKYWPTWLGIGSLHLLARLPMAIRIPLARALAALAYRLAGSRRRVAETNIRLCFAQLSPGEQARMVRGVFFSTALSMFETAHAWCRSANTVPVHFEGLEFLETAQQSGSGILLTGGHFAPLDIAGALVARLFAFHTVYRKHDNPLFNYFMARARERYSASTVARKDLKKMFRVLQHGEVLWYAPDQDYGRKASIFVPFFGIETATITMTSKLAKAGRATVLPVWVNRTADHRGFVVRFHPPLDIPSGDDAADARTYNQWLQTRIEEFPDQYLWLHKRFKTRPEGEQSLYR